MPEATPDLRLLLEHSEWVRALARTLVPDPNLADDLAQETWLSALRSPPREVRSLRAWLGTVLRRQAGKARRSASRRNQREEACARDEAQPGADEVVERVSVHRDLVHQVMALDEPYRTTILLRFFEGLSYADIARRMDTTSATVNSRLTRGLAQLRDRIDGEARERGLSRAVLMAPLLHAPGSSSAPIGILIMNLKVASVALAVGVGALWVWSSEPWEAQGVAGSTSDVSAPRMPASTRSTPSDAAPLAVAPSANNERSAVDAPSVRAALPAPTETRVVRGIVLGAQGVPIAGVRLDTGEAESSNGLVSDVAGRFAFETAARWRRIVADDPRYVTVFAGGARADDPKDVVVVIARPTTFAGVVLGDDNATVAGVELEIATSLLFTDGFEYVLDRSVRQKWRTTSDAAGRFRFERVPALERSLLLARAEGYAVLRDALPPHADEDLVLRLERPDAGGNGTLSGLVVHADGSLAPRARVSAGGVMTRADDRGRFRVSAKGLSENPWARAFARGVQPAIVSFPDPMHAGDVTWPADVVLELGEPPLSIEGRVAWASGEPATNARVWLLDPTLFGFGERDPVHAETLQVHDDAPFWSYVETNADGRFRIEGLAGRNYELRAIDPNTLASTTVGGIEAGARDVRIELAGCDGFEGVLVTDEGAPIANAGVYYEAVTWRWEGHSTGIEGVIALTDEYGRFSFPGRCFDTKSLWVVDGPYVERTFQDGGTLELVDGVVEVVIDRGRIHAGSVYFRVELAQPDLADAFAIVDADGERCKLVYTRANESDQSDTMPLVNGRSQQLSTRSNGRTLVLYLGGEEVARHPVQWLGEDEIAVLAF